MVQQRLIEIVRTELRMKGIRQIGIPLRGVETAMGLRAGKLKIFLGGIDSQEADRSAPLDVSAHRRKIDPCCETKSRYSRVSPQKDAFAPKCSTTVFQGKLGFR